MQDLKVTIIQSSLHWENVAANLAEFDKKFELIVAETDLIVLPEMFNTGFSMQAEILAEEMFGKSMEWMLDAAIDKDCIVAGSLIIQDGSKFYNRFIWMRPDGTYEYYDKKHLFRMAREQLYFSAGDKRVIVELKGWRICLQVCYDLRFPVWSRNRNDYDVLLYVANWPERRNLAWKTLLQARAIENQAYVIGVNRVGKDGNDVTFSGDTVIMNPQGGYLAACIPNTEEICLKELSWQSLDDYRESFPVGMDADNFEVN
ncbi:MAG: amidohydrolase [Flavobacteriales bacterium]|nr:amidohydrolase [Flavobacteriales bacterium]